MAFNTAIKDELSTTARALRDLGNGFLDLLPGMVLGLVVFGLFFFLSGFAKRTILRATRGSGYG